MTSLDITELETAESTGPGVEQLSFDLYDVLLAGMTAKDLPFYLSLVEEAPGPVLELACGTGRILVPLARQTGDAVGLDFDPRMLDLARERLVAEGLQEAVRLVQGDMRSTDLGRDFRWILMGGQPLFQLASDADVVATLENAKRHLASDGTLVAGMAIPRFDDMATAAARGLFLRGEYRHPVTGRRTAVWDHLSFDPVDEISTTRRIFEILDDDGRVLTRAHTEMTLHYRSPKHMLTLLDFAGLRVVAKHGGYDRSPLGPGSDFLVWCAQAR